MNRSFISTLFIIFLAAIIVGGGVYLLKHSTLQDETDDKDIFEQIQDVKEINQEVIEQNEVVVEAEESQPVPKKHIYVPDGWTEDLVGSTPCARRGYSGEQKLRVWREVDEVNFNAYHGDQTLMIHPEDIDKVPHFMISDPPYDWAQLIADGGGYFTLADAPQELKERIRTATRETPIEITLKGYAFVCEGPAWASLNSVQDVYKLM